MAAGAANPNQSDNLRYVLLLPSYHRYHHLVDASLYKDAVTSRVLTYHYYFSPAQPSNSTLLFCHGFPSTSCDWQYIAPRLNDKGYGVLTLDMLSYDGTDKHADLAVYVPSLISKDTVDVLGAEKLEKVIYIGQDCGCKAISCPTNYYHERILDYVFPATSFVQALPPMDFQVLLDSQLPIHVSRLAPYRASSKGCGALPLGMFGIGETDKPIDPASYVLSLTSRDIADVLDAEKLDKVNAIGHGWGCKAVSHLTSYHPERIFAYVFLGISFVHVSAPMDFQEFPGSLKQQLGCKAFG
ncbi:uncharacterized protein PHACADRAFT_207673 [Phanerochaete carnosa HHB-10118-sp]|uniref:AB hydrolase-1 domain-containing protein n=1 Tax=Phanerochaete carnosa (strain HHB-10118-sp) TaxID=650164 RepID=K5V1Q8_PHACS|nr:uncharacterized protein PHACADRAFT_207673 [Phanerochaete carnosa HHB-10118-sp]EKM56436.1 hypothetical protein PHACADRAFT_207673 [Phanerochaete carnosa HHB-10118-sp]